MLNSSRMGADVYWKEGLLLAAVWIAAFYPTLKGLVSAWAQDPAYSHAFVIPVLCGLLIWRKRSSFQGVSICPSLTGAVLLVTALLVYALSAWGGIVFGQRCAVVASLCALAHYNYGPRVTREIRFPLLALFLAVPLPVTLVSPLTFQLQSFATTAARLSLNLMTVPATQEGNILSLPHTTLFVAEACSGLTSLVLFMTAALFVAHWFRRGWPGTLALFGIAFLTALFSNVVRISLTGVLANRWGGQIAQGTMHEALGVVLLGAGLMLLVQFGQRVVASRTDPVC